MADIHLSVSGGDPTSGLTVGTHLFTITDQSRLQHYRDCDNYTTVESGSCCKAVPMLPAGLNNGSLNVTTSGGTAPYSMNGHRADKQLVQCSFSRCRKLYSNCYADAAALRSASATILSTGTARELQEISVVLPEPVAIQLA